MPSFMGGAAEKPVRELVKEMDDETRRARLHAAAARVQEAEWEDEIPAAVHRDPEEMFAILDKSETGSITLSDWLEAGLDEAVFNQIDTDRSGTIEFSELVFAADEDTFTDFSAVMCMPAMPDMPAMPEMPSFMGGAAEKPVRELVKEMDDETRRARLHAAAARVQEAEWEDEIPAAV